MSNKVILVIEETQISVKSSMNHLLYPSNELATSFHLRLLISRP